MMTLIARLCGLCAVSTLIQMALDETNSRASLRMINAQQRIRFIKWAGISRQF